MTRDTMSSLLWSLSALLIAFTDRRCPFYAQSSRSYIKEVPLQSIPSHWNLSPSPSLQSPALKPSAGTGLSRWPSTPHGYLPCEVQHGEITFDRGGNQWLCGYAFRSLPHHTQKLAVETNGCYKSRAYRCISTLNCRQLNSCWKVLYIFVIKLLTGNAQVWFSSLSLFLSLLKQKWLFQLLSNYM